MNSRFQRALYFTKKFTVANSLKCMVIILFFCQGCAAYRTHDIPETYKPDEACSARVRLIVNANHFANGTISPPGPNGVRCVDRYTKSALEFFRKANIFQEIGTDIENPDIEITLNIREEEQFSHVNIILGGLTLMVIPVFADVVKNADVQVAMPDGQTIANYSAETGIKIIMEILLIPAMPTFFNAAPKSTEDLYQMIITQMQKDPAMRQLCPQFSRM